MFITSEYNHPEFFITLGNCNEVELMQREHKRRRSLISIAPPTTPTSKTLPTRSQRGLLKESNKYTHEKEIKSHPTITTLTPSLKKP
jgi:hypothetical protein